MAVAQTCTAAWFQLDCYKNRCLCAQCYIDWKNILNGKADFWKITPHSVAATFSPDRNRIKDLCLGVNAAKLLLPPVCVCYHSDCCPLTRQQLFNNGWWKGAKEVRVHTSQTADGRKSLISVMYMTLPFWVTTKCMWVQFEQSMCSFWYVTIQGYCKYRPIVTLWMKSYQLIPWVSCFLDISSDLKVDWLWIYTHLFDSPGNCYNTSHYYKLLKTSVSYSKWKWLDDAVNQWCVYKSKIIWRKTQ